MITSVPLLMPLLAVVAPQSRNSPAPGAQGAPEDPRGFSELHLMVPVTYDDRGFVVLGDVDDDGDLDAVVAGGSTLVVMPGLPPTVLENDGNGYFTAAAEPLPMGPGDIVRLALGDLDGDGSLDVYSARQGRDQVVLNDGTGGFELLVGAVPPEAEQGVGVVLADVDGDGCLDAIVANNPILDNLPRARRSLLLFGEGTGGFEARSDLLPSSDATSTKTSVAAVDVDLDGDVDLVFGSYRSLLYVNSGTGAFTDETAARIPPFEDPLYARHVAAGDVDGDGAPDLFLGHPRPRLARNDGSGFFTDATGQLPAVQNAGSSSSIADVDGDGDLDILAAGVAVSLFENVGGGQFVDSSSHFPIDSTPSTTWLDQGDLDGDGDVDAFLARRNGGNLFNEHAPQDMLFLNDGSGRFVDVTASDLELATRFTGDVGLGDVDGDGHLDAFLAEYPDCRLLLNDGAGRFREGDVPLPPFHAFTGLPRVALQDLDRDNDLDALLVLNRTLVLFSNQGDGTFVDVSAALPVDLARDVAVGDLDGNGTPDAFLTGTDEVLLNDGRADFTLGSPLPRTTGESADLADVDGDGDLDVLVGGSPSFLSVRADLFLNTGVGVFEDATDRLPAPPAWSDLALGDVDDDGDPDAYLGTHDQAQDQLWINTGGTFVSEPPRLPPVLDRTLNVAMEDIDRDGDLDVLVATTAAHRNKLLLNDGTGHFDDGTSLLPADEDQTHRIGIGDLDGDGDLDLFYANAQARNRVLFGLESQLAWRSVPRVGKPFFMDVLGAPHEKWILAVSSGRDRILVPKVGTFYLDPVRAKLVDAGGLDEHGSVELRFAVPGSLALVDTSLYWQVLYPTEPRLGNLEITTLLGL